MQWMETCRSRNRPLTLEKSVDLVEADTVTREPYNNRGRLVSGTNHCQGLSRAGHQENLRGRIFR